MEGALQDLRSSSLGCLSVPVSGARSRTQEERERLGSSRRASQCSWFRADNKARWTNVRPMRFLDKAHCGALGLIDATQITFVVSIIAARERICAYF